MLRMAIRSYLLLMVITVAAGAMAAGHGVAKADAPPIPPHINRGDVLVQFGQFCLESCHGQPSDSIDILARTNGGVTGELHLGGVSDARQLAIDQNGRIYTPGSTTGSDGVSKFYASGGTPTAFLQLPSGTSMYADAIAFDMFGNLFVSGTKELGEFDSIQGIFRYAPDGTPYLGVDQVPVAPLESGQAPRGIGLSGCTLGYGEPNQLKRYNICTNAQMPDFPVGPGDTVNELHGYADGSFVSAELVGVFPVINWLVKQILPDGTVRTFSDPIRNCPYSADADPETDTLYVLDPCSHAILRFTLSTGAALGVWKQYEYTGEQLEAGAPVPVHLKVYDHEPSKERVLFVHGLNRNVNSTGEHFSSFLGNADIVPYVRYFRYYQDRGNIPPQVCGDNLPTIPPAAGIPIDTASEGGSPCDSQGDLGLNALALDEEVHRMFEANGGQKVILIGYSMGAAIIRGFLDYSTAANGGAGDGVAGAMVDSVMFIAGAHDGSWMLVPSNTLSALECIPRVGCIPGVERYLEELAAAITAQGDVDFARPAATELSPLSSWYGWANSSERPLPGNIGYYNAYGNIALKGAGCVWLPFLGTKCHNFQLVDLGDGQLFPGTDDPYGGGLPFGLTDPRGGSRFARPNTTEQWQWNYYDELVLHLPDFIARSPAAAVRNEVAAFLAKPGYHVQVRTQSHDVFVFDCVAPENTIRLDEQFIHIIKGKLALEAYQCPTH